MDSALLLEGGEPTYNESVDVVRESATLATASQQYWVHRLTRVEAQISDLRTTTASSDAEKAWKDFCASHTAFLNFLLARALSRLEKALRVYWNGNKPLSKDAVRLFRDKAKAEILIPFHDNLSGLFWCLRTQRIFKFGRLNDLTISMPSFWEVRTFPSPGMATAFL